MKIYYSIQFEEGLHSRIAIKLVELCKKYNTNILITKVNNVEKNISCKNLIRLLTACIKYKDEIEITIDSNEDLENELNDLFIKK